MHTPHLNVGSRIRVQNRVVRLHLLQDWHSNGSLVSDWRRYRRRAGSALALVLALDKAVGNAKDGVNNDGVDAFGNLVLWGVSEALQKSRTM
jgi:hypothetical protein